MSFFPPGTYKARLINNEPRLSLFEIVHIITIHRDGSVTEHHHYLIGSSKDKVVFTPERVWNPALLSKYHLEPIDYKTINL